MFFSGQQLGSYILIHKLGKGGFGEVWLAEKHTPFISRKVAIKLPLDEQVNLDAIRQEATLWEAACGHPNVLPIIDADIYDGQAAIISEYADGGSLADKIKRGEKYSILQAVEIAIGILNGLHFLHSKNIIHRDIKPANVLLQGGTPRLADFGISRAMNTSSQSSQVVGTESYMSPESFEGKRNWQTDIWSVGVVLYQLLKGDLPFPQEHPSERMFAILTKEFEPLPEDLPEVLRDIVKKALEKEPEKRFRTALEMRDALQSFQLSGSFPTIVVSQPNNLDFNDFAEPEVETEVRTVLAKAGKDFKEDYQEAEPFQDKHEAPSPPYQRADYGRDEQKADGRKSPRYYKFWEKLLELGKTKSELHYRVKPRYNDGICVKNVRGLKFHYVVNRHDGRIEFYIDRGDTGLNKRTFDELLTHKSEIDAAFGEHLSWERLDHRKTCRLGYYFQGGVNNKESDWQAIHEEMIDAMIRLEKAVSPFIPKLLTISNSRRNSDSPNLTSWNAVQMATPAQGGFHGNIWKFGCTWGGRENPSFYEFIKEKGVVIGVEKFRYSIGDLVLIAEGFTIKAIAMVEEEPQRLMDNPNLFPLFEKYKVDFEERVNYAKAEWYELDNKDVFTYSLQAGAGQVHQQPIKERVVELWNSRNSEK